MEGLSDGSLQPRSRASDLAWIGSPLRKRLDETLEFPYSWELSRLLADCEAVAVETVLKNDETSSR